MPGYHSHNGSTAITNRYFLQDILQEYMHYDGLVVSDYGATAKKNASDGDERYLYNRARDAINAGAHLELHNLSCFSRIMGCYHLIAKMAAHVEFPTELKKWITEPSEFIVKIGSSSSDIRLEAPLTLSSDKQEVDLRQSYHSLSEVEEI